MERLEPAEVIDDALAPYAAVERDAGDRCWVLANMVGGLDGSAAIGGRVGALSGGADAELFRRMRAVADVVLVGAETVRRERYGPARLPEADRAARTRAGRPPAPPIAVVSRSLALDWTIPLFAAPPPASGGSAGTAPEGGSGGPDRPPRPLVVTAAGADADRAAVAARHADVVVAGEHTVDLSLALERLAARGHRVVLCEGGPTLLGEIVAAGLLDELCLTISPVMGGDPLPVATVPPGADLVGFRLAHVARSHDVLFLRYERAADGP
jgi:riboflavin biosynthesis pyrimidine reductase